MKDKNKYGPVPDKFDTKWFSLREKRSGNSVIIEDPKGKELLEINAPNIPKDTLRAVKNYSYWHQRVPDSIGVSDAISDNLRPVGIGKLIAYRSSKWIKDNAGAEDYQHIFGKPLVPRADDHNIEDAGLEDAIYPVVFMDEDIANELGMERIEIPDDSLSDSLLSVLDDDRDRLLLGDIGALALIGNVLELRVFFCNPEDLQAVIDDAIQTVEYVDSLDESDEIDIELYEKYQEASEILEDNDGVMRFDFEEELPPLYAVDDILLVNTKEFGWIVIAGGCMSVEPRGIVY